MESSFWNHFFANRRLFRKPRPCRSEMANSLGIGSWRKWCLLVMILVWLNYYLVGGWPTPLKNMSSSVGIIFPNMGKNVPNHKPVMVIITSSPTVSLISLISLVLNANIATWAPPCTATRWVSNLLCRWARRFSFSPSQRFSVSPGNKGQWWFHWLWNYWQVLHSLQLYTQLFHISFASFLRK